MATARELWHKSHFENHTYQTASYASVGLRFLLRRRVLLDVITAHQHQLIENTPRTLSEVPRRYKHRCTSPWLVCISRTCLPIQVSDAAYIQYSAHLEYYGIIDYA